MLLLRESLAIFRRNPLITTTVIFLIAAASMGQVLSLGALYPILQVVASDEASNTPSSNGAVFVQLLSKIGAAPTLTNFLLLFVVLGIGYSILNWFADTFQGIHLRNFESSIRQELLETAVYADWLYLKGLKHGEFINVITQEATQYRHVVKYALITFGSFLQFAVLLIYALYLNWKLTVLGIFIFGAGSLVLIPILSTTAQLGHYATQLANNMANRLIAALRSYKTAKAFSLELYLVRSLQPSFREVASNYFHQGVLISGQYAIMEIIAFVAISTMLFAGLNVLGVPKADLFIVLVLLFRALPQARNGIDNYHRGFGSIASVQAVRRHLGAAQIARERQGGLPVPEGWRRIEFRNVSFAYPADEPIIKDFSTRIHRGEFWAIVGPSGSGKTTLLDILLGLLVPQEGQVSVDGAGLEGVDLPSWHSQFFYLGQEAFAFAGTLRENLMWGSSRHLTDTDLVSALRAAKLDHVLDKDVGENGCNLSGGEKQRLALARLFLRQANILVLDEPTTGLDAVTEKEIFESIATFFKGRTLIMVTHREELTLGADHIIRFTEEGFRIEARTSASPVRAE